MNHPLQAVWKFELGTDETEQRYTWPYIVEVLTIQMQNGKPCLWARVLPGAVKRPYKIMRFLTGDPIDGNNVNGYLGTVTLSTGDVLHYFSGGPGL